MATVTIVDNGKTTTKIMDVAGSGYTVKTIRVSGVWADVVAFATTSPDTRLELELVADACSVNVEYHAFERGPMPRSLRGVFEIPRSGTLVEDILEALRRF